ncbi:hypothetical protein CGGC5_v001656 [Colletotrichum fructicola Nara gc5]|nr:hypothetical protein CGGC5_v001656 [Colletotrichum fructicola Nara gc5]
MGDWSTETVLAHQMMRKLVSHEVDINGPFEPRIDGTFSRHFEVLQAIPVATAEVLNFPDLQIHILRHDEKNVSQILRGNPYSASEQNCFGQNSVHVAVIVGDLKVLQAILLRADASPLNTPDYAKLRDRYPIEYAVMPQFHSGCHNADDVERNGCDILDALFQSDCALYPSFFLSIFFGCTRSNGGTADCALRKVMLCLKERRQRPGEYAKKHLPPTQAAELGLYGTNVLDEAAGDVQTALKERFISVPLSLRVFEADIWRRQWWEKPSPTLDDYEYDFQWFCEFWAIAAESQPWANSSKPTPVFELILRYMTFTALGLRHSCCRLAQFDVVQDWDIKDMDEIMEEQHEETLRLEAFLEELEQDHRNSPDLETFVGVCWGPKVSMVIDELNARKLDEDDLKAAQETGIEWHCFETKTVENDYSRSSDLEYWMDKLNAIVPEPGSDIPLAPDLPVRDT